MSEYTEGPWRAEPAERFNAPDANSTVAWCGDWRVTTTSESYEFHGTNEADARLIAAAPELLDALNAFVVQATKLQGYPQAYVPYSGALVAARAAIKKATGGDA